jgi:hypothetical protein
MHSQHSTAQKPPPPRSLYWSTRHGQQNSNFANFITTAAAFHLRSLMLIIFAFHDLFSFHWRFLAFRMPAWYFGALSFSVPHSRNTLANFTSLAPLAYYRHFSLTRRFQYRLPTYYVPRLTFHILSAQQGRVIACTSHFGTHVAKWHINAIAPNIAILEL